MTETVKVTVRLLLMVMLGIASRKRNIVDEKFAKQLSALLIDVIIPCYIFSAISRSVNIHTLVAGNASAIPTALILMVVLFLIGTAGKKLLGGDLGRAFRYGTMFSNALLFGMPICESAWGREGLLYLMTFYIPVRFGYYGLSEVLLSPDENMSESPVGQFIHVLRSPAVVAYILALLLLTFGIHLPETVSAFFNSVGNCCSPLGMMLIGMIIGGYDFRTVLDTKVLLLSLYKLFLLPLIILLLVYITPVRGFAARIPVLFAALPCGSLLTTFCIRYDPDNTEIRQVSSSWVLLTSAGVVFSAPFWLLIMGYLNF